MREEKFASEIRRTFGRVRKNGAPAKRRSGFSYARIARAAFEDICGMTEEGFSYAEICEALEADGILPEGSESRNLGRAIRRERARRKKRAAASEAEKIAKVTDGVDEKPRVEEIRPATPNIPKPEMGKPFLAGKPAEREWARQITESTEETGLGKLTKHPDGSFDFDWNN